MGHENIRTVIVFSHRLVRSTSSGAHAALCLFIRICTWLCCIRQFPAASPGSSALTMAHLLPSVICASCTLGHFFPGVAVRRTAAELELSPSLTCEWKLLESRLGKC